MQLRPNEEELPELRRAAHSLQLANAALAAAKKSAEAAKATFEKWLMEKRGLDVATMPIGEVVMVQDVVLLKIGKQNKFDELGFKTAEPVLHARFMREFPMRRWDPLV